MSTSTNAQCSTQNGKTHHRYIDADQSIPLSPLTQEQRVHQQSHKVIDITTLPHPNSTTSSTIAPQSHSIPSHNDPNHSKTNHSINQLFHEMEK